MSNKDTFDRAKIHEYYKVQRDSSNLLDLMTKTEGENALTPLEVQLNTNKFTIDVNTYSDNSGKMRTYYTNSTGTQIEGQYGAGKRTVYTQGQQY